MLNLYADEDVLFFEFSFVFFFSVRFVFFVFPVRPSSVTFHSRRLNETVTTQP